MALVLRKNQDVPLSNSQLDGNFEFLNGQLDAKYDVADFTASNISDALNTPALLQGSTLQTVEELCESNDLNAFKLRGLAPSVSGTANTIATRSADGYITSTKFIGPLEGNALTATTATTATTALGLDATYTVPIARGGTGSNTAAAARTALEVLHLGGTNSMTNKLNLFTSVGGNASLSFGVGITPTTVASGDMWSTVDGLFYRMGDDNYQIARTNSPTFTGVPLAPGVSSAPSQIVTLSHLSALQTTLENSIALKANLNNPSLTGNPTAPTQEQSVINTTIATTSYTHTAVNNKASTTLNDSKNYTDAEIQELSVAITNLLALKANSDSAVLTGTPISTTPSRGNNSQRIATTAYVTDAVGVLDTDLRSLISSLVSLINSTRPVPTGSVFYIASSVVPTGYLECNGQWVLKASYEALWTALGSPQLGTGDNTGKFQLPDLRGEFIRGWDNGRGVDTNRTLLSWQKGTLNVTDPNYGSFNVASIIGRNNYSGGTSGPVSAEFVAEVGQDYTSHELYPNVMTSYITHYNAPLDIGTSGFGYGATRPRNVALMPIIKF